MSAFFLSGTRALTVIADKEEIKEASTETEDLFRGVRKNEVAVRPKKKSGAYVKSVKMLQALYQSIVSKVSGKTLGCIINKRSSDFLRKSLIDCTKLLGARGDFNASDYKKWAEIYYEVSVLIFGGQGFIPTN